MSGDYYVKAKDCVGDDTILRVRVHHGDVERIDALTEEDMQKEIKRNQ